MAGAVNLRYLVLGLLAQRPMSGYDIKRFLKSLSWLVGSPSSGSLYPILRTLLRENLLSQEVIPGLDRPPRKIYSITDAGRRVLQAWVDEPVKAGASLKAFVMRLLIADHFSRTALASHLQQRQTQIAGCQTALEKMTEAPGQEGDLGQRLALSYGLALATAELAWLDYTLDQLPEQPFLRRTNEPRAPSSSSRRPIRTGLLVSTFKLETRFQACWGPGSYRDDGVGGG